MRVLKLAVPLSTLQAKKARDNPGKRQAYHPGRSRNAASHLMLLDITKKFLLPAEKPPGWILILSNRTDTSLALNHVWAKKGQSCTSFWMRFDKCSCGYTSSWVKSPKFLFPESILLFTTLLLTVHFGAVGNRLR